MVLQPLGGQPLLRIHIDLVLDLADARGDRARADLEPVRAARQQGGIVHPQQMCGELVGHFRRVVDRSDDVAAADIDLVVQGQRDRLAGACAIHVAIGIQHRCHLRAPPGRHHHHGIANPHLPGRDGAGIATKMLVGTIDPLHRQAEPAACFRRLQLHGIEMLQQMRAAVPRHPRRGAGQIFAIQCR